MAEKRKFGYADIIKFYVDAGFEPHQAAGFAGNFRAEAGPGFPLNAKGDKGTAHGLMQLRGSRYRGFLAWSKQHNLDRRNPYNWMKYSLLEMTGKDPITGKLAPAAWRDKGAELAYRRVLASRSLEEATRYVSDHYERPGIPKLATRITFARKALGHYDPSYTPVAYVPDDSTSYTVGSAGTGSTSGSYVTDTDMTAPDVPTFRERREEARATDDATKADFGLLDYGRLVVDQWGGADTIRHAFSGVGRYYDPSFRLTMEHMKEARKAGVRDYKIESLLTARSEREYRWLVQKALNDQDLLERAAQQGWTATAANIIGAVTDPTALAIALASEGAAAPLIYGAKASRLERAAKAGLVAGIGNTAVDAIYQAADDKDYDWKQALSSFGVGITLGSMFGAISRKAGLNKEARMLEEAGRRLANSIEKGADDVVGVIRGGPGSAGAAGVSKVEDLSPEDWLIHDDSAVPYAFFKGKRFSSVGQLGSSKNPLSRVLGQHFGLDVVSGSEIAATEIQHRIMRTWMVERESVKRPAWIKYWKDRKENYKREGWMSAKMLARRDFEEDIVNYIRNRGAKHTGSIHPSVKRMGEWWVSKAKEIGRLANNPGADEGRAARSIAGFEKFVENSYYVPRMINHRRLDEMVRKFGDAGLEKFFKMAFWRGNPKLDEAVAERVGKAYLRRLRSIGAGVEDDTARAANTADFDEIRNIIDELDGLEKGDHEKIMSHLDWLDEAQGKGTGTARGKRRVLFDEGYKADIETIHGGVERVSFDDFLINDFTHLSTRYFRDLSGWIALGKMQVRHPETGRLLVDGITSEADFKKLIRYVRKAGQDAGLDRGAIDKDVENLEFLYQQIRGVPEAIDQTKVGQWMRRFRDYNFTRVMNLSGFPSMSEISTVASTVGIKALMQHVPTFRRIVKNGKSVRNNELASEIEAAWGVGADRLLGGQEFRWDHFGDHLGLEGTGFQSKAMDAVDRGLTKMKEITSDFGLLRPVTQMMQQWVSRAAAQKFAKLAMTGKGKPDKALLKSIGFKTDEELDKVLVQLRKHAKFEDGVLGKKLVKMNIDKWDPEAASTFKNALYRWTRRAVQENDPGMMHRWMSKPFWRMLLQFRTFMLGSYEAQFLHNVHAFSEGGAGGKWRAFTFFTGALMSAAAFYTLRVEAVALGMAEEHRKAYRERMLSPGALAAAAFSRSAWSSWFPGVADTVAGFAGADPIFGYRTTSYSNAPWSNPTTDLAMDLYQGGRSFFDSLLDDREMSKPEVRRLTGTLPFQNSIPFIWLLSNMIEDKPDFEPRR